MHTWCINRVIWVLTFLKVWMCAGMSQGNYRLSVQVCCNFMYGNNTYPCMPQFAPHEFLTIQYGMLPSPEKPTTSIGWVPRDVPQSFKMPLRMCVQALSGRGSTFQSQCTTNTTARTLCKAQNLTQLGKLRQQEPARKRQLHELSPFLREERGCGWEKTIKGGL